MNSDELIKILKEQGWLEVAPRTLRNHRHFRHPSRNGKVTVAVQTDLPASIIKRIEAEAGISLGLTQLAVRDGN